jgi:ATP-binding cassette subfamily B protein
MEKITNRMSGQNPLLYLFKKTLQYSEGNRKNIVWLWVMFIVANAITLFAQPFVWAKIINVITQQGITAQSLKTLLMLLAAVLLIDLVFWSIHGPARIIERTNAFKARLNYRKYLLKGVMTLPMEWHAEYHSGDTVDKIGKGSESLYSFSEDTFEVIAPIIQLIGSYAMLVYFSPPSAFIVLAMIAVTAWITIRFDRVMVSQYHDLNHHENNIAESVFDTISNITTVIILRIEKLLFSTIVCKMEKPFMLFKRNIQLNEYKWFLTNICCTVMTIAVLSVYFSQHVGVMAGLLVGNVYLLINYLGKISNLFYKFTQLYGESLQRKAKIMNSEELTKDFVTENFTNHVLPATWHRLDISDLHFSYDNDKGSSLHLNDIALSIIRGQRIALVGETGSGKTTLLKVIRDLYHPTSLNLSVDGRAIPSGFEGIKNAISLVPQDPQLFATTIIENITLGAEHAMDFVRQFTDMACFTEVADALPQQFNTSIKEDGINLSGGQRQRLALARGLLACHDKDIVLLDEPTSSLDAETEMSVYRNIFERFQDKTVISTIHRLHLLPLFDKIYFFHNGKIVGAGTLNELLSSNPRFQKLWQKALFVKK